MIQRKPMDLAASVRQRLLNISKERIQDFSVVLTQYASERLLYRLSKSEHVDDFVLKGAMLFAVWTGHSIRPTRDLDLLGYGDASQSRLRKVFEDLCVTEAEPDGLLFDPDTIRVSEIREAQEYGGQRVLLAASIGDARIPLQIDIGFGDTITPKAEFVKYPVLLQMPAPRVHVYPRETVVAEKLQAMVALGMLNSRMKDLYDLNAIGMLFSFESKTLVAAIKATFECRRTVLPEETPVALTSEFCIDRRKSEQWHAFVRRTGIEEAPAELAHVVKFLNSFLALPLKAAAAKPADRYHWPKGGPWRRTK